MMSYSAHTRAVLALGIPLTGGHLAQMAIGVTDTVMLGWYGVDALAAVTLGSTYFFVLFIFGSGFAWAVMPMVAAFGAQGDEAGIRRATRMAMWLSVAFAFLALPLMLWSEPILRAIGQTDSVTRDAAAYLRIAGWGILPALLVMALKSYLAALERTQVVFWITVVAAVINGFVNYALIFGNWGAPELGIAGAAIASVITHIISFIGIVIYVLYAMPEHSMFQRIWRADGAMLWQVFTLGWPIGLTALSEVGLFAASATMMGWLGTVPLAAHGVALQLASITFMLHLGLSNVATIRAGNALGRKDRPHLVRGAHVALVLSLVIALCTMVGFTQWPHELILLFVQPDDPALGQILTIGVGLLAMAALFQLVDGAQVVALGLLRGLKDTQLPMVFAAVSYWGIGVPCSYLFGFVLGLEGIGVWLGLVVGLGVAAVLLNLRFWGWTVKTV